MKITEVEDKVLGEKIRDLSFTKGMNIYIKMATTCDMYDIIETIPLGVGFKKQVDDNTYGYALAFSDRLLDSIKDLDEIVKLVAAMESEILEHMKTPLIEGIPIKPLRVKEIK